jgi:hypothetical protein
MARRHKATYQRDSQNVSVELYSVAKMVTIRKNGIPIMLSSNAECEQLIIQLHNALRRVWPGGNYNP